MNVATSRSCNLLLPIGNVNTLKQSPFFLSVIKSMNIGEPGTLLQDVGEFLRVRRLDQVNRIL